MRRAFSLVEIVVAAGVLAALLLPLLTSFSTTAGAAGDDARKIEATNLALEIIEQVTHMHKRLGKLPGIPLRDLELYSAKFMSQQGVPLSHDVSRSAWNTRLFLQPSRSGYRRWLSIQPVEVGPETDNVWPDALVQVRVRVTYTIPLATGDVEREVLLVSNYFQKCRASGKFRSLE